MACAQDGVVHKFSPNNNGLLANTVSSLPSLPLGWLSPALSP